MTASTNTLGGAALGAALTLGIVFTVTALKAPTTEALAPSLDATTSAAAPAVSARPALPVAETLRPAAQRPRPMAQPTVVRTVEPMTIEQEAPRVESKPSERSWKKTVMVIGGSTAAGAGIGGLVGGKTGALVGAAIGGGASTIYESAKR
jgi:hypothetical protein